MENTGASLKLSSEQVDELEQGIKLIESIVPKAFGTSCFNCDFRARGNYCEIYDDEIPDDYLIEGCEEWQDKIPF